MAASAIREERLRALYVSQAARTKRRVRQRRGAVVESGIDPQRQAAYLAKLDQGAGMAPYPDLLRYPIALVHWR